jgi:hypothetical protein
MMTWSQDIPQPFRGGRDDAPVGLVRNHDLHVFGRQFAAVEKLAAGIVHLADGELEHGLSVLFDAMQVVVYGIHGRRHAAAAGGHLERVAARAVDLVVKAHETLLRRLRPVR